METTNDESNVVSVLTVLSWARYVNVHSLRLGCKCGFHDGTHIQISQFCDWINDNRAVGNLASSGIDRVVQVVVDTLQLRDAANWNNLDRTAMPDSCDAALTIQVEHRTRARIVLSSSS